MSGHALLEPSAPEKDGHRAHDAMVRACPGVRKAEPHELGFNGWLFLMPSFANCKAGAGHVYSNENGETSIVTELRPIQGQVCAELLTPAKRKRIFASWRKASQEKGTKLRAGPLDKPLSKKRPPGRIDGRF